jgi:probable HAF family extracellular repeat protein
MKVLLTQLVAALIFSATVVSAAPRHRIEYAVTNLESLGGTISRGNGINNRTWVIGYSNTTSVRRATLWKDGGDPIDLGSLGGPNGYSSVVWPVKNNNGLIAGISQTSRDDPNDENWSCSPFLFGTAQNLTGLTCVGFVWRNGEMRELPRLGGHNAFVAGANNRGQITGWSETDTFDPKNCVAPQKLQFRPVIWGPGRDQITELPLIPGDSSGAATAINDRGQAIGISGICDQAVGRRSAIHAVLWDRGRAIEIVGDNGGPYWDTPMAINDRGEVVGFVGRDNDPDGNQLRAFYWSRRKGFRYLTPLPGYEGYSEARGLNNRGQIVGISCTEGAAVCRPVIWRNAFSPAVDLDTLAPDYDGVLATAQDINDAGEITGRANAANGERVAFLARPKDDDDDDDRMR